MYIYTNNLFDISKTLFVVLLLGFLASACGAEKEPGALTGAIAPTLHPILDDDHLEDKMPEFDLPPVEYNGANIGFAPPGQRKDRDLEPIMLVHADSKMLNHLLLSGQEMAENNDQANLESVTKSLVLDYADSGQDNDQKQVLVPQPEGGTTTVLDAKPRVPAANTTLPLPTSSTPAQPPILLPSPTPEPICGGNQYHDTEPAVFMEQMPIDFENFGTWMRSDHTYGAFLQTDLLSHSGSYAAWFCYYFNSPEDETAVFTQVHPIPDQPNHVQMWVYGNRSGHFLSVWILDNEGETWLIPFGPISHEGWQELDVTFAGPDAVPVIYISGPSNHQIDYPVSFRGIAINDVDDAVVTYGSLVVDEIRFEKK